MTPDSAPGGPPGAHGRAVDLNAIRRTDMVLDLLAGRRLRRPHSFGDRALVLLAGLAADTDDAPLPSRPPSVPACLSGTGLPGSQGYVSGQGRVDGPGQASGAGRGSGPGAVIPLGLTHGGLGSTPGTVAADDEPLTRTPGPRHRWPVHPLSRPGQHRLPEPGQHRLPGPGQRWQAAVRLSGRPRRAAGGWARSLAAVMTIVAAMAVATGLMVAGMFTRRGGGHRQ